MTECRGFSKNTVSLHRCDEGTDDVVVYLGKERTECLTDHPYSVSRRSLRGDSRCIESFVGQEVTICDEQWRVEGVTCIPSACRTKIDVVRPSFTSCAVKKMDLYKEVNLLGCTSDALPEPVVSDVPTTMQLEQASVGFSNSKREWDEMFRIYMEGVWTDLIGAGHWLYDGTNWYSIKRLFDVNKCGSLPYAVAKKECPPWSVSAQ